MTDLIGFGVLFLIVASVALWAWLDAVNTEALWCEDRVNRTPAGEVPHELQGISDRLTAALRPR